MTTISLSAFMPASSVMSASSLAAKNQIEDDNTPVSARISEYLTKGNYHSSKGDELIYEQVFDLFLIPLYKSGDSLVRDYRAIAEDKSSVTVRFTATLIESSDPFDLPEGSAAAKAIDYKWPNSVRVRLSMASGHLTMVPELRAEGQRYYKSDPEAEKWLIRSPLIRIPKSNFIVDSEINPHWNVIAYENRVLRCVQVKGLHGLQYRWQMEMDKVFGLSTQTASFMPIPQVCRCVAEFTNTWIHTFMSDYEVTRGMLDRDVTQRTPLYEHCGVGMAAFRIFIDLDHVKASNLARLPEVVDLLQTMMYRHFEEEEVPVYVMMTPPREELRDNEADYSLHIVIDSAKAFRMNGSIRELLQTEGFIGDGKGFVSTVLPQGIVFDPKVYNQQQKMRFPLCPKELGKTRVFNLIDPANPLGAPLEWPEDMTCLLVQNSRARSFYDSSTAFDLGAIYRHPKLKGVLSDADFEQLQTVMQSTYKYILRTPIGTALKSVVNCLRAMENSKRVFTLFYNFYEFCNTQFGHNGTPGAVPLDQRTSSIVDPIRVWNRAQATVGSVLRLADVLQKLFFMNSLISDNGSQSLNLQLNLTSWTIPDIGIKSWERRYTNFSMSSTLVGQELLVIGFATFRPNGISDTIALSVLGTKLGAWEQGTLHFTRVAADVNDSKPQIRMLFTDGNRTQTWMFDIDDRDVLGLRFELGA